MLKKQDFDLICVMGLMSRMSPMCRMSNKTHQAHMAHTAHNTKQQQSAPYRTLAGGRASRTTAPKASLMMSTESLSACAISLLFSDT